MSLMNDILKAEEQAKKLKEDALKKATAIINASKEKASNEVDKINAQMKETIEKIYSDFEDEKKKLSSDSLTNQKNIKENLESLYKKFNTEIKKMIKKVILDTQEK